jgi:DNA-binding transcriptional regulator/RsmH inhibitor MraZ
MSEFPHAIDDKQRTMLPANMATMSVNRTTGKVMCFKNGIFGEWVEFETLADAIKCTGNGMMILTVCD